MSRAKLPYLGPQLQVAGRLTGWDHARLRRHAIDVKPDRLVHGEPPVPVGDGASNRARLLPATRRLGCDIFCRLDRSAVRAMAQGSKHTRPTISSSLLWTAKPLPLKESTAGVT